MVARDREAALRSALGASAWSLVQSALAEVCLLSVAGGLLGVVLAKVAVSHFARFAVTAIPRADAITVDGGVLALSVFLTVGATILFGTLPAMRFLRVRPQQALQGGSRASVSRGGQRLRRWLIGAQVFGCTTLLLVTGLFARSLVRLLNSDRGFSTDHVVAASVMLQGKAFTDEARASFDEGALEKLRSLPGVQSASMVSAMLLQGESWIDGVVRPDQAKQHQSPLANYRWISPDYFATIQQPMLEGRALDAHDRSLKNAVISEATAKAVWPGESPLGRQFARGETTYTVVGVVADARNNSLREAPVNMVYLPYWDDPPYVSFFLVRSSKDTELLADSVRKAIWGFNPDVTIASVSTLDSQVGASLAPERMETVLLATFGGAAFLLALLGIYGTLNYSVQARTQEIGVRMALGASRRNIYLVTLMGIVVPVAAGLGLGWIASVGIGRAVSALLYGTAGLDVTVAAGVIASFAVAAVVATYLPCRRAAMVEPMEALRAE